MAVALQRATSPERRATKCEGREAKKPAEVLLIEDNPGDVRLIKEMLGEVPGARFHLHVATRLSTGLESLAQKEPDVILLDLGLPDSQGLETLGDAGQRFRPGTGHPHRGIHQTRR
ncbi:MAG: response regulator [Chloroflexi bacterium]|nr:response regulator [Chloroflexota bacterium]